MISSRAANSAARRRQVAEELENRGPTPETAAKSRRDQVSVMLGRGLIDKRQQEAADELRDIIGALQTLYFNSGGYSRVDGQRRTSFHHLDGLPQSIQRMYLRRYVPFKAWAASHHIAGKRYLEWVFDAIIDNTPEYSEKAVVDSLEYYADLMEGRG